MWGSQYDENSGGGNGDLENFGRAVITNQLQTLTMPAHMAVLTNRSVILGTLLSKYGDTEKF